MWLTGLQQFLILHLKVGSGLNCSLFTWDSKSALVIPKWAESKLFNCYHKSQQLLNLIYVVAIILKIFVGRDPVAMKCQGFVFLGCLIVLLTCRWNWSGDSRGPLQTVNAFLNFEKGLMNCDSSSRHFQKRSIEDKLTGLFLQLLETTAVCVPLCIIAIQLHAPCSLPFLGSLSPFCRDGGEWTAPPLLIRLLMLGIESWIWLDTIYDGTFYIFYLFFGSIVCLLDYIGYLRRLVSPAASSNELDNDGFNNWFHTYRCVQLLEQQLNDVLKLQVVPAIIGLVPQIQVFSLFVCIKLYSVIPMPGFTFFPLLLADSALVNVLILTLAAKINSRSVLALGEMKIAMKSLPPRSRRLSTREIRSCSPRVIKFGQNYVDRGTPLVIQNFCLNQTLSLLLLNKRGG